MKLRTDRYSHVKSVLSTGSVQILSVKEQCGVELAGHLCPVVGLLHLLRRGPTMGPRISQRRRSERCATIRLFVREKKGSHQS